MAETGKHRVWNKSRDTLLCDALMLARASDENLEGLIGRTVMQPGAGLWLNPCIGAPHVEGVPPFDLVCIDQNSRVTEQYESFQTGTFVLFLPRTTSAMIFPARAIAASQTEAGDQLDIAMKDERGLDAVEEAAASAAPVTVPTQEEAAPTKPAESDWGSAPEEEPAARTEKKKDTLGLRFLRWLVPDRRKSERQPAPNLTARRWAGDQMYKYAVEDVSKTGVYIVTDERPFPGTIFMLTLSKKPKGRGGEEETLTVQAKVARWGQDGLGLQFVAAEESGSHKLDQPMEGGATAAQIQKFLK